MVDLATLVERVKGLLRDPIPVIESHSRPAPPWTVALTEHALPLMIGSSVASLVLTLVFSSEIADEIGLAALIGLVALSFAVEFVMLLVAGGAAAFVSGLAGGSKSFDSGFVLVALSMTPSWIAEAISPIPILGIPIAILGAIWALVLFFRGASAALGVAPERRIVVVLGTLGVVFLASIPIGLIVQPILSPILFGG